MDKNAANYWMFRSKQLKYWWRMSAAYSKTTNAWLLAPLGDTWRINLETKCFEMVKQ